MKPEVASHSPRLAPALGRPRAALWLVALLPLVLLGLLLALLAWQGPSELVRGTNVPPTERLTFQAVQLRPEGMVATVLNDGPDPVTIAQVQVDDAYWSFSAEPSATLGHLGRARLTIPYPWVWGEAHALRLVTSTGVTFDHEIAVAIETPQASPRAVLAFALIGLYVGVIPVAIGLLWRSMVVRLGRGGLDFVLALTIGLLLFLLVDASGEGLELAAGLPGSFQGPVLFVFGAAAAYLALETLGAWLRRARAGRAGDRTGWVLALLVAIGIGLHNFGEGLAIGAAFALGEAALGTMLIVGFTLHNTTEGLAIVAPLARERVRLWNLVKLGLVAGAPTIAGAWLGGFVYSPVWSVLFLAIGAGAIAQVVVQIARQMAGDQPISSYFTRTATAAGLMSGVAVMYVTGMLVG
ncbi:MAG: metal transporter [Luteitalea sp.]|nr:metal transporter [Luteitalea sp.]